MFYKVDNKIGKMNAVVYNNQCLKQVLPILKEKQLWLQEDNDKTHNSGKFVAFKRKHNIRAFQTPTGSPDLSVAESFARPMKSLYGARGHFQKEEALAAIIKVFYAIRQEDIQKWILSMPSRLQRVIDSDGEHLPDC